MIHCYTLRCRLLYFKPASYLPITHLTCISIVFPFFISILETDQAIYVTLSWYREDLLSSYKKEITMGYLILILLSLFELIYTIRCFQTKDTQQKLKQFLHLTAFLLFTILTVTKIIEWSFRYYLLGLVLLILAVIAVIRIVTSRYSRRPFHPLRLITKELGVILMILFLVLPSILFPQYKEPEVTGTYEVSTATYTYTDTNRIDPYSKTSKNRFVNVEFWYPKNADEPCPLVLFSHGSYGIRYSNESTYRNLASNGYIVCSLDHPYHSFFTQSEDGTITLVDSSVIQLTNDVNNDVYDEKTQIQLMRDLTMIRVDDLNFVLDTILTYAKTDTSDNLYHQIDCSKIGVFGHSLGGAAAMELGRVRDDVSAVINLDGDMLCEYLDYVDGELLINEEPYPCPLLNLWSDNMIDLMEASSDTYLYPQEYIAQTASVVYDVHMEGTNHFSFTDLVLFSPILPKLMLGSLPVNSDTTVSPKETLEDMNAMILEFFDCYLRQLGGFHVPQDYQY